MTAAAGASVGGAVPADVAPDGSPVEVFALLPAEPAAGYVLSALPRGADVLELGCGAGRLTRVLRDAGHAVVAVDESAAMLARVVPSAGRVLGDAATVRLDRRFGAVILASYLVNDPERGPAMLATAAAHLAPGGIVVVQRYDPVWARACEPGEARVGAVTVTVADLVTDGNRFRASVTYGLAGRRWRQEISATIVDDDHLDALAAGVGLAVVSWIDELRTWAILRTRPTGGRT